MKKSYLYRFLPTIHFLPKMNYSARGFACTNEEEVAREWPERFVPLTKPPAMQALCLKSNYSKPAKNMKFRSEQRIPQWKTYRKEKTFRICKFLPFVEILWCIYLPS